MWQPLQQQISTAAALDSLTEAETCTTVRHELMHFAKVPMEEHHDDGCDAIYACARFYTTGTQIGPAQPPPTPNEDCAAPQ